MQRGSRGAVQWQLEEQCLAWSAQGTVDGPERPLPRLRQLPHHVKTRSAAMPVRPDRAGPRTRDAEAAPRPARRRDGRAVMLIGAAWAVGLAGPTGLVENAMTRMRLLSIT